ncbi:MULTISPECIES: hypothetical protein [Haloferax]|uniref:DUF3224 domain-containing protein n=2 Tax=Haloferax TaxID=2251 RepID=A0A6G1Z2L5_9EURY|nr:MULTISPECIES: hypothetical protein [Haloferax]KAB1188107.1 hypothetical protein Hfx1149_08680 [Haloferax sp. CBA1149]MRW80780.1 hypothetical protein [Haloferax marinisediminis]
MSPHPNRRTGATHARGHTSTRRALLRVIGGTALLGSVPAVASAQQPQMGTGTGQITNLEITNTRYADGVRHEDRHLEGTISGTLDGTFEEDVSGTVFPSGRVVLHGTMTFTGQVADCGTGTLHLKVSGQGTVTDPAGPIVDSTVRVVDQAANTLNVTGQGTVRQEGPNLSYDVQYRCR